MSAENSPEGYSLNSLSVSKVTKTTADKSKIADPMTTEETRFN